MFVISRTSLNRGSFNRGSTVYLFCACSLGIRLVMTLSFLYDVSGISVVAKDVVKLKVVFIGCWLGRALYNTRCMYMYYAT